MEAKRREFRRNEDSYWIISGELSTRLLSLKLILIHSGVTHEYLEMFIQFSWNQRVHKSTSSICTLLPVQNPPQFRSRICFIGSWHCLNNNRQPTIYLPFEYKINKEQRINQSAFSLKTPQNSGKTKQAVYFSTQSHYPCCVCIT